MGMAAADQYEMLSHVSSISMNFTARSFLASHLIDPCSAISLQTDNICISTGSPLILQYIRWIYKKRLHLQPARISRKNPYIKKNFIARYVL
jgi:hypothetical protein